MMQKSNYYKRSAGFTIIELMISTAVFSTILVVVAAGAIIFSRQYQKGVINNQTQVVANHVMNQMAQGIQFSGSVNATTPSSEHGNIGCLQIGSYLYSYHIGAELKPTTVVTNNQYTHALVVVPINAGINCGVGGVLDPVSAANYPGAHELLSTNMRLGSFKISSMGGNSYSIDLSIIYGDDDLLAPTVGHITDGTFPASEQCKGSDGDQFCSKVVLHTLAEQRV